MLAIIYFLLIKRSHVCIQFSIRRKKKHVLSVFHTFAVVLSSLYSRVEIVFARICASSHTSTSTALCLVGPPLSLLTHSHTSKMIKTFAKLSSSFLHPCIPDFTRAEVRYGRPYLRSMFPSRQEAPAFPINDTSGSRSHHIDSSIPTWSRNFSLEIYQSAKFEPIHE